MSVQKLISVLKIFIFAILLTASSKVFAQAELQCEPVPDCEELGYKQEVECPNGAYVACPFNAAYKKCVNQSCADLGFSTTDKSRWCKVVVTCPTDLAYTLCAEPDPCASFNLTFDESLTYDSHCYECSVCNSGNGDRYKCVANLQPAYYIIDGVCTYDPCDGYDITNETYLSDFATEPEVHCQTCESCVSPEGPTVWKCNNLSPQEGYFVAENGVCTKDACFDYRLPESLAVGDAANCYDCTQCPTTDTSTAPLYAGYWKCEVSEKNDYHLVGTECVQDPCPGYTVTQAQYESKYGSEDGKHCYDCQKCNNDDSTYNGNWKCTAKENIESPYSLNATGDCVSDPCAGYDLTQSEKNAFLQQNGDDPQSPNCYDCEKCIFTPSAFFNKWRCLPKETPTNHYHLIGEVCEPDPCNDHTITPEQYTSTYSQGNYSECFKYTPCQDPSSDFYGYYKQETRSPLTWGYYIEDGQCLKDPCYDEYKDIGPGQIQNYDPHCYDCEQCPNSPSGDLENYYKCTEEIQSGYELINGRCAQQPCADYNITDPDAYIASLGQYWRHCVDLLPCTDPSAPDEFKNNYKAVLREEYENGYLWSINDEGLCTLCGGLLCANSTPGNVACSSTSENTTFYENCTCTETCPNNVDVTINGGTCRNPAAVSGSSLYVKLPYFCTNCYSQNVYFYQFLSNQSCYRDCQGNCNPIYQTEACATVDSNASYCFGTDSQDIRCNAMSDPNCTPKRFESYYWCDSCSDKPKCTYIDQERKYYDDNATVMTAPAGCSLSFVGPSNCLYDSPAPSGCYYSPSGYYYVDTECTKPASKPKDYMRIVYKAQCNQKTLDCHGNAAPAYNQKTGQSMTTCSTGYVGYTYQYDQNGNLVYDGDNNLIKLIGDDANPVLCGGKEYYDGCQKECEETCSSACNSDCPDFYTQNDACVIGYVFGNSREGYDLYQFKCQQTCVGSTNYWYMTGCEKSGTGCDGNNTPYENGYRKKCPYTQKKVNGEIVCQNDDGMEYVPVSGYQDCGGKRYADAWKAFCTYEETQSSCADVGKCFRSQCTNTGATMVFGECYGTLGVDC